MKILCVFLLLAAGAEGQARFDGEITGGGRTDLSGLTVRVLEAGRAERAELSMVDRDGRFQFHSLPAGSYLLQVLSESGNVIAWEQVNVSANGAPVTVELPEERNLVPTGKTVAASQLMHPPDKRAIREALKGEKFSAARDYAHAAEQFAKAVAEDPYYSDAYNNLGVQYVRLGRPADAISAFQRAAELDPGAAIVRTNLAVLLAQAGQFDDAESYARQGVRLDPANEKGRQVLESILAAERVLRARRKPFAP